MDVLMNRLREIQKECNSDKAAKEESKEKLDPFSAAKRDISGQLRDIRLKIKERDQQERDNPGTKYGVELSHQVRMQLDAVNASYKKLSDQVGAQQTKYDKALAKGKKQNKDLEQQLSLRTDVLQVISRHIEECTALERRRGAAVAMSRPDKERDPTVTSLPDVDDPRFQQLIRTDQQIDELLDRISEGVKVLGQMAGDMHEAIEMQGQIMSTMEDQVERANETVITLNKRLRKIVTQLRSGDRFCVDFILICVIIGLAGLIYNVVRTRL
jgi:chromosome segregation ATPase